MAPDKFPAFIHGAAEEVLIFAGETVRIKGLGKLIERRSLEKDIAGPALPPLQEHAGGMLRPIKKAAFDKPLWRPIFIVRIHGTEVVFNQRRTQGGLMNIVSLVSHRDKAPTNALVASSVKACTERELQFLTYSRFSYGKKEVDSLSDFKERNGFQRIDVPRYYIPVSPIGKIALDLGLHHKLAERVPEGIAGRLREFREAWYRRKYADAYKVT